MHDGINEILLTPWTFDLWPISEINTNNNAIKIVRCNSHYVIAISRTVGYCTSIMSIDVGGCTFDRRHKSHGRVDDKFNLGLVTRDHMLIPDSYLLQIILKKEVFPFKHCLHAHFHLFALLADVFLSYDLVLKSHPSL